MKLIFKYYKYFISLIFVYSLLVYLLPELNFGEGLGAYIAYLSAPFLALFAAIAAFWVYGFKSKTGIIFMWFTLGIFFWLIGEVVWFMFDYILGIDPFPSVADIFYLLGYPFLLISFILGIKSYKRSFKEISVSIKFFLTSLLMILTLIIIYFGIYLAYDPTSALLENLVGISYGVGDLVLLITSVIALSIYIDLKSGKLGRFWIYVFMGMALTLIADILFVIYNASYEDWISPYYLIDLLWIASYLLFALAFVEASKVSYNLVDKIK